MSTIFILLYVVPLAYVFLFTMYHNWKTDKIQSRNERVAILSVAIFISLVPLVNLILTVSSLFIYLSDYTNNKNQ